MTDALTAFDIIVLLFVTITVIYALMKGLTTMLLTVLAWVGAIIVTLYAMPYATDFAQGFIQPTTLANVIALPVLFIGSLIILKLIASAIGSRVRTGPIGALDRSLGAALGLFLGAVLVSTAYLFFSGIVSEKRQPDWIQEAQLKPLVSYGAAMVAKTGPELFSQVEKIDEGQDLINQVRGTYNEGKTKVRSAAETAYEEQVRRQLDEKLEDLMKSQKDEKDPSSE